jgi:hypothetical protein
MMEVFHCPVCLDDVPKHKSVRCPNGHWCCEKHHIQRIKAVYETRKSAFDSGVAQHCFECRCHIPDELFSNTYHKLLFLTQLVELPKMFHRKRFTNEEIEKRMLDKVFAYGRDA